MISGADFLENLNEEQRTDLVAAMSLKTVEANEVVIEQGGHGSHCYIIESGSFDCVKRQTRKELTGAHLSALLIIRNKRALTCSRLPRVRVRVELIGHL